MRRRFGMSPEGPVGPLLLDDMMLASCLCHVDCKKVRFESERASRELAESKGRWRRGTKQGIISSRVFALAVAGVVDDEGSACLKE